MFPNALWQLKTYFRAGFPSGAFQTLLIGADAVERILSDDRIVAATLTGSEPAGSSVASIAGKHIKKTVLELGGAIHSSSCHQLTSTQP